MSLLPLIFDDLVRPTSLFDQNFGLGLLNDDLLPSSSYLMPHRHYYMRVPWRNLSRQESGMSNVTSDSSKFQVNLDVQQFKPDGITVKSVDNAVVIEGKHEERQDQHGYISRQFMRRYVLPEGIDKERVECKLSSDGVLTISAPKLEQPQLEGKTIPIIQTNHPALQKIQAPEKSDEKDPAEKAKL